MLVSTRNFELKRKATNLNSAISPSRIKQQKLNACGLTLDKLPEELILDIVEHIIASYDNTNKSREDVYEQIDPCLLPELQQELSSISLVNRRFNDIVTPFLYKAYLLDMEPSGRRKKWLRTLCQNPVLRECVKSIWEHSEWAPLPDKAYTDLEIKSILPNIASLALPDLSNWTSRLSRRDCLAEVELAIAICQTPKIEIVKTNQLFPSRYSELPLWSLPILHAARNIPYGFCHTFSSLRVLDMRIGQEPLSKVSCLFNLPSLRELGILSTSKSIDTGPWECRMGTSNVQHLWFLVCDFSSESVKRAIRSCKALTRFTFSTDFDYEFPSSQYDAILSTLQDHRRSLKHIRLFSNCENPNSLYLNEFEALEAFHLRLDSLRPDENGSPTLAAKLPSTLKWLYIELTNSKAAESNRYLEDFANTCSERLKDLKAVDIYCRVGGYKPPRLKFFHIERIFKSKGISFKWDLDFDAICKCRDNFLIKTMIGNRIANLTDITSFLTASRYISI